MAAAGALAWAAVIVFLCVVPRGSTPPSSVQLCLICGDLGAADFVRNVLLFVPLGLGLGRWKGTVLRSVLLGFLLSFSVEFAQVWIPGRYSGLGDLVSNTLGTVMGAWLVVFGGRWILPEGQRSRRLAAWSGAVTTAAIVGTGLLVVPSIPSDPLFGNWTPSSRFLRPYPGRVLSAEIAEIPLPSTRIENPAEVRTAFHAGDPFELSFQVAPPPTGPTALFRLIGTDQREAFRIDIRGNDIIVVPRYLATDLRIARPSLRFADALEEHEPLTTVGIRVGPGISGGYAVQVEERNLGSRGLTAASGGSLLLGFGSSRGRPLGASDFAWLFALFAPVGWWAISGWWLVAVSTPPLFAMWLIPLWTPLLTTPIEAIAWAIACSGIAFASRRWHMRASSTGPEVRERRP